eukprot:c15821_g1_i1 orf=272-703(-)
MEMDTAVDNMSNGRSVIGLAYPITLHGLLGIPMDDLQYDKENIDSMAMTARPASRSPLPSWYPRLPLQDITAVLRSMQVDARKKGVETPKTPSCRRVVPVIAVLLDANANRLDISGRKEGRHPVLDSSCMDVRSATTLRKSFR